jgi:uncharacterized protein (TIGR03086 family)
MSSIDMCERVVNGAIPIISSIRPEDMNKVTPCAAWTVQDLAQHMTAGHRVFAEALDGKKPAMPDQMPDVLGDDPGAAYANAARATMARWREPGALERTLSLPFADIPASTGINIYLMDQLIHTWDLAEALGRDFSMDADLAEAAHQTIRQIVPPEARGPGGPFGPELSCAADAPVLDRLLAVSGRQPKQ